MVTETRSMRADIAEKVEVGIQGGATLEVAAQKALDRVLRNGDYKALLQECGLRWIQDIWRDVNIHSRIEARGNGEARHNTALLNRDGSLLETLHKVGDRYIRLGDMDKRMCREVQGWHSKLAESALRQSHFFSRIADSLKNNQTVASKFSDDQLRSLLTEFKVE